MRIGVPGQGNRRAQLHTGRWYVVIAARFIVRALRSVGRKTSNDVECPVTIRPNDRLFKTRYSQRFYSRKKMPAQNDNDLTYSLYINRIFLFYIFFIY